MSYSAYDHDKLEAAESMRIERRIFFEESKADISALAALSVEQLQAMREESAAAEQAVFEGLQRQAAAWEEQAGKTLLINKAISYARTPPVKHTSNEWEQRDTGRFSRSNMVYQMDYHFSENTRYDRASGKSVPYSYTLTWSVRTNGADGYGGAKFAGQTRKVFADKADMEKYLNGRIKAYQHLFTEISPPVPQEYAGHFKVSGYLLPGYTIEGEQPPQEQTQQTEQAAQPQEAPAPQAAATPEPEAPAPEQPPQQEAQAAAEAAQPRPVVPIVFDTKDPAEKMKDITGRLEQGIQSVFDSDNYKNYLNTLSKFHTYSFNNTLLIAMQGGHFVKGYRQWQTDFGRQVKKDEDGIKILAPAPYKAKRTVRKLDPETKQPVIGADGKPVMEEKEVTIPAFKVVSVFDVSQTEGKEMPPLTLTQPLIGDVEQYDDFFSAIEKASPFPIHFEQLSGAKGVCRYDERAIAINEGMSQLQNVKTAIHEAAHAKLHDTGGVLSGDVNRPDKRTREVQAESIAYAVCQYFGLDTSDYSFGYLAEWSSGKELSELKASLETVQKTAKELITEIEGHFLELQQAREADAPQHEEAAPEIMQEAPAPEQPSQQEAQAAAAPQMSLFDRLPQEQQQALSDTVRDTLQTLVDMDLKNGGEVSAGTLEAIAAQGYSYRDGQLEKQEPTPAAAAPEQTTQTAANLTDIQKKAIEIAQRYENLPLQEKIGIIAQAFGGTSGEIVTSPCTGKWRGTSDMSIKFDNGASLFIGNHVTPKTKTAQVRNEFVNAALVRYNPEIISASKEAAHAALMRREAADNEIATQKGLKPYTLLNVEFNDGTDEKISGHIGWYYVTLAVDGKICSHLETGLNHDIADGKVSDTPTRENYYTAGALKEADVDYVFNNVGFSSASAGYSLHISDSVRERAEKTLAEREAAQAAAPAPNFIYKMEANPRTDSRENSFFLQAYIPQENGYAKIGDVLFVGTPEKCRELLQKLNAGELTQAEVKELFAQEQAAAAAPQQGDTFTIYQLKGGDGTRDFRFEPYDRLLASGHTVDPANYEQTYTAPLTPDMTLESIFTRFNVDRPADFTGHSLSVSDVVVLHQNGQDTAHYVDRFGFKDVPEFLQEQQQALAPDDHLTGEKIETPRGSFHVTDMSREQMEAAGYGFHHNSDDGKYAVMGNGTRAFAISNEPQQRENPLKAAEQTTEQNENMLDGLINNEPPEASPPEADTPAVHYYPINEAAARHANDMNSYRDYKQGSATAQYRQAVDEAAAIAKRQKDRVDPMYHEKIDSLLDTYARKLAENMNKSFSIESRVPSILVAGGSNFPTAKKHKQNAARDRNMEEWRDIQGLLDKIRSTGMGGISADDPQAVQKLEKKLAGLERAQETMKAVNAYYRKHKTLDGCPHLTPEQIEQAKAQMSNGWRVEDKPYPSWALSNNSAEIRRVKERIASLTQRGDTAFVGWEFDGGKVECNRQDNRLQIYFDDKPDPDTRAELKSSGFRWSPSAGAWQRQLNDNAIYAADGLKCIRPTTGERPTEIQRKARAAAKEEKPSIRAQLAAAKEQAKQQPKKQPEKSKGKEMEV